jgi:hypothetical protein
MEHVTQGLDYPLRIRAPAHLYEVDNDGTSDTPQSKLPTDFHRRFDIRLHRGFFWIATVSAF